MKKNTIILLTITIAIILVTVIGATYAYFQSGTINTSNVTNLTGTTSDATNISIITLGDNISLNISSTDMLESNQSLLPVSEEDGTISISLTAGSNELPIECEYDLYYVYEQASDTYTRSSESLNEFTYKVFKNGNPYTGETNFVNTTSSPQRVITSISDKIVSYGSASTNTYQIKTRFYNINANQSANSNKNFNLKFYINTSEERCTKYINQGYTGTMYRYSFTNVLENRTYVDPIYNSIYLIGNHPSGLLLFPSESICNSFLAALLAVYDGNTSGVNVSCVKSDVPFEGITNDLTYNEYWYISSDSAIIYYNELDYCQTIISGFAQVYPEFSVLGASCILYPQLVSEGIDYTTDRDEIREGNYVYLKHEVYNGKIIDSKPCLKYDAYEFCVDKYYHEFSNEYTIDKLKEDMESALHTTMDGCSIAENYISCYKNVYNCNMSRIETESGWIACAHVGDVCVVGNEGYSNCRHDY